MTARPKPVDLTEFEGMTQGEWYASGEANIVVGKPVVHTYNIYKKVGEFDHVAACKKEFNALAIVALPDLIADLQATRDERTTLKAHLMRCIKALDVIQGESGVPDPSKAAYMARSLLNSWKVRT